MYQCEVSQHQLQSCSCCSKVMTANLQSSLCENKPAVNVKKVAVDVKKHDGVTNMKTPSDKVTAQQSTLFYNLDAHETKNEEEPQSNLGRQRFFANGQISLIKRRQVVQSRLCQRKTSKASFLFVCVRPASGRKPLASAGHARREKNLRVVMFHHETSKKHVNFSGDAANISSMFWTKFRRFSCGQPPHSTCTQSSLDMWKNKRNRNKHNTFGD